MSKTHAGGMKEARKSSAACKTGLLCSRTDDEGGGLALSQLSIICFKDIKQPRTALGNHNHPVASRRLCHAVRAGESQEQEERGRTRASAPWVRLVRRI